MKKRANKVLICGRYFKIQYSSSTPPCGHFDCSKDLIQIGTENASDDLLWQILVHEVVEAIFTERNMRFCIWTGVNEHQNMGLRFVFNHQEYENAGKDIAAAFASLKEGK